MMNIFRSVRPGFVWFVLAGASVAVSTVSPGYAEKPLAPLPLPPADGYAAAQHAAIVLQRSNGLATEAMPLGNGSLGAAVWSAQGLTVQLNRADTLPNRLSPGQLIVPGLKKLTQAPNYQGRLDLATGEFVESGAGMQATVYIDASTDALVVQVTGADPDAAQTAELRLWEPRQPRVLVQDGLGTLAETWQDVGDAGATKQTFGSLAALHVDGDGVSLAAAGKGAGKEAGEAIVATFHANRNGSYRVVVAAPGWRGEDAVGVAAEHMQKALAEPAQTHRDWWKHYWSGQATPLVMRMAGDEDGTAQPDDATYFGELREIYLYTAAAEVGSEFPGSHAGIGDLFSSMRDVRYWDPSAYWHWNLRMMTAANQSAGVPQLNRSYFTLYRENLNNIEAWTKQHMGARAGICVPETMRFNGQGWENETWAKNPAMNCGEDSPPFYNARTLSTGAEVALWIWRQYRETDDRSFLAANYPVMRAAAQFLLAYAKPDAQGTLHTFPSNAHETQWDVHDPLTDIVAMRVVFPEVVKAAQILGKDADLVAQLKAAESHLLPLPEADAATPHTLLRLGIKKPADAASSGGSNGAAGDEAGDEAGDQAILVNSYEPGAAIHNVENIGLEPVWPYEVIGPEAGSGSAAAMHALGVRTFDTRPYKNDADWSDDPLQAAHLGLGGAMRESLDALTETYQKFPSGLAEFISKDFFVEQIGVLAASLDDALVQQKADGTVLIAPAWPAAWDADGTVEVENGLRVRVVMHEGAVQAVVLMPNGEAVPGALFSARRVHIRNPWPGHAVTMTDGKKTRLLQADKTTDTVTVELPKVNAEAADLGQPTPEVMLIAQGARAIAPIALPPDNAPLHLGTRTIGLAATK
jgi:alpha-L-fucosidase 2